MFLFFFLFSSIPPQVFCFPPFFFHGSETIKKRRKRKKELISGRKKDRGRKEKKRLDLTSYFSLHMRVLSIQFNIIPWVVFVCFFFFAVPHVALCLPLFFFCFILCFARALYSITKISKEEGKRRARVIFLWSTVKNKQTNKQTNKCLFSSDSSTCTQERTHVRTFLRFSFHLFSTLR